MSICCIYVICGILPHWLLLQNVELIASLREVFEMRASANQSPAASCQGNVIGSHVDDSSKQFSPQVIYLSVTILSPVNSVHLCTYQCIVRPGPYLSTWFVTKPSCVGWASMQNLHLLPLAPPWSTYMLVSNHHHTGTHLIPLYRTYIPHLIMWTPLLCPGDGVGALLWQVPTLKVNSAFESIALCMYTELRW